MPTAWTRCLARATGTDFAGADSRGTGRPETRAARPPGSSVVRILPSNPASRAWPVTGKRPKPLAHPFPVIDSRRAGSSPIARGGKQLRRLTDRTALAVDVGGTRLRTALVDDRGRVLHEKSWPTSSSEGADAVGTAIAEGRRSVLDETETPDEHSLRLCCPGPIDAKNRIARSVLTICGFVNFPVAMPWKMKSGCTSRLRTTVPPQRFEPA